MARIKAKQISEFQDVGAGSTGTTGQYLAWDSSTGKYTFQNQPLDGDKGSTGAKGDKGSTGAKGQKGQQGADGVRGDDWSSGAGAPSITGSEQEGDHYLDTDNGNVYYWDGGQWVLSGGILGPTGPQGAKGDKGSTGAKGDKGSTGAKGDKGSTGAKGDKGNTGADSTVAGPKGDKGSTGADSTVAGPKGDKGNTGADSTVAGPKGDKGSTGQKGEVGAQGDKGAAGADGATGAAGATGATGPQGQKGDTGATGTSASISNAGNNRVVTSDGSVAGLVAESNFTFTDQNGGAFDVYAEDIDLSWGEGQSHFRVNAGPHIGTSARVFGIEQTDANYAANTVVIDPTHMITDAFEGTWWPVVWDSTNGALAYQVSSRQFKRDIQPIGIDIDLLFDKVNAVEYKFVDDDSDRVQVGFIAEEVEEWDPRFVLHDAEGKPRSLDYGRMVPALFEVIKDLRARIEILENKNN